MSTNNPSLNMILGQLYTNNLNDKNFLNAFDEIPRDKLLPSKYKDIAYADNNYKISDQVYQMSPQNLADIIIASKLRPTENILEIGSGCGINALILSKLVNRVDSVTSSLSNVEAAINFCEKNNIKNCQFSDKIRHDYNYDLIIINGHKAFNYNKLFSYLVQNGKMIVFEPCNDSLIAPLCDMNLITYSKNISKIFIKRINMFKLEPVKI